MLPHLLISQVGPAMFFSRRCMLFCRQPNYKAVRLNCNLTPDFGTNTTMLFSQRCMLFCRQPNYKAVRLNCDLTPILVQTLPSSNNAGSTRRRQVIWDLNWQLIICFKNAIVKNTCVRQGHLILRYVDEPHTRFERRSYVRTFKICKYQAQEGKE